MTDHCNWENNWIVSEGNEKQGPSTKTYHYWLFSFRVFWVGLVGVFEWVWVFYESKVILNLNVLYDPPIRG